MNKVNELYCAAREAFYRTLSDVIRAHPTKNYRDIAAEQGTSVAMVIRVSKLFGLTRTRGRRPATKEGC